MTGYATREVAQALGLSSGQVRSYVRSGLLQPSRGPRGRLRFSFTDLVFLRTARELRKAGVATRSLRRGLRTLARQRPESGLTDLKIGAEGGGLVVDDGTARWRVDSGQALLDFGAPSGTAPVQSLPPLEARSLADAPSAEDWYARGTELEAAAPAEARTAYENALRLDAEHAQARVNLGRLLHETGDAAAAEAHYRAALEAHPEDGTAAFNLGVALEDLGREADAMAAYERALAIDAEDADAHWNAANLCERLHDAARALEHWKSYRRLTRPGRR